MAASEGTYCYGSVAVELAEPRFIVHEGGAGHAAKSRPAEAGASRASARGILACVMLAVAIFAAGAFAQASARNRIAAALESAPTAVYTVREGDSLWAIASDHEVESVSTGDVVEWIRATNSLDGSLISTGQRLVVPQGALS